MYSIISRCILFPQNVFSHNKMYSIHFSNKELIKQQILFCKTQIFPTKRMHKSEAFNFRVQKGRNIKSKINGSDRRKRRRDKCSSLSLLFPTFQICNPIIHTPSILKVSLLVPKKYLDFHKSVRGRKSLLRKWSLTHVHLLHFESIDRIYCIPFEIFRPLQTSSEGLWNMRNSKRETMPDFFFRILNGVKRFSQWSKSEF